MKNIFGWLAGIIVVVGISIFYHEATDKKFEDTIVDDVDMEGIVEIETNANNGNTIEDNEAVNDKDTNHNFVEKDISGDENDGNNEVENNEIRKEAENIPFSDVSKEADESVDKTDDTKLETMAGAYSTLSNKTNAWGFVRKPEGTQPEFHGPYTKVLDDYEGIYAGNKDNKVVYLTFDEGYENGYTAPILDSLKEKGVTAVFFVTMPYVKQNPDLIKRMIAEGHIVGNHTVNHPSMPEVTNDEKLIKEIMDLHNYMVDNYNYEMTYLRPPKGEYSERTVKLALDLGYKTVLWSSAYDDWDTSKQDRLDYARKMIYNNLHNGSVILLHAVSKDNANILSEAIDEIRSRGYEFRSLDEFEN